MYNEGLINLQRYISARRVDLPPHPFSSLFYTVAERWQVAMRPTEVPISSNLQENIHNTNHKPDGIIDLGQVKRTPRIAIPKELRELPQWVCWKLEERYGEETKPPINPKTGKRASTTNSRTWSDFDTARKSYKSIGCDGIGFVFTKNDPYCGIDLDGCRDEETGEIKEWAQEILKDISSYTEVSQSGGGLHIISKAQLIDETTKEILKGTNKPLLGTDGKVEIYDRGRYFATTGKHLSESPPGINTCQEETLKLYRLINPPEAKPQKVAEDSNSVASDTPDEEIIRKASEAKNGQKFRDLMDGDWKQYSEYPSESEADLGLCCLLAFWTRDYDQILRTARKSELWDKKWEREDYQRRTIQKALLDTDKKAVRNVRQFHTGYIRGNIKPASKKQKMLSDFVYGDLLERGRFIRTESDKYFYFLKDEKKVMKFNSMDFISLLNDSYNIVESETDYRYVAADLRAKCHMYGEETDIYRFAYFDKTGFKLYVDKFDGQVYLLDGEEISIVDNGTDGVLFEHDEKTETYEISELKGSGLVKSCIIDQINFETDENMNLSMRDQRTLLRIWLFSIFFESIMPTKTIVLFIGVKGSGKTSAARMIGQLLFGRHFDVKSISEERDFAAVVSNNYLVAFDNADTRKYWLNDRLAMTATGQVIELRKLYTTNEAERYYPRCFLVLTARTPQFKRDDVVDRLLIFRVKRIEDFRPENVLLNDITNKRSEILSELFHTLNVCIRRLKKNSGEEYTGSFRMADFASFGYRILNGGEHFLRILEKMDEEQSEFLLEDDPLIDCLFIWLDEENNPGRAVTASELYAELKYIADMRKTVFLFKSPQGLGNKLRHQEKNLQNFCRFEIQTRKGASNQYVFNWKEETKK